MEHQANSNGNILSASLSAHFKGKHLGLRISQLIESLPVLLNTGETSCILLKLSIFQKR